MVFCCLLRNRRPWLGEIRIPREQEESAPAAKFTINRCFYDYSARAFILGLGDFEVYVAVYAIDVDFLQKRHRNVEHLEFVSGSGWLDGTGIGLRPAVNRVYRRLDREHGRYRYMFFGVPIIGNVWL
jgi:hypothetical protein